MDILFSLRGW